MSEGPFLKDHPCMTKLKNTFQDLKFGSGFTYETGDDYAAVYQCVFDARHNNDILAWAHMIRKEVNSTWEYPIVAKPIFLESSEDVNPYTSDVICMYFVPKEVALLNERFDGDIWAGAISRLYE